MAPLISALHKPGINFGATHVNWEERKIIVEMVMWRLGQPVRTFRLEQYFESKRKAWVAVNW